MPSRFDVELRLVGGVANHLPPEGVLDANDAPELRGGDSGGHLKGFNLTRDSERAKEALPKVKTRDCWSLTRNERLALFLKRGNRRWPGKSSRDECGVVRCQDSQA